MLWKRIRLERCLIPPETRETSSACTDEKPIPNQPRRKITKCHFKERWKSPRKLKVREQIVAFRSWVPKGRIPRKSMPLAETVMKRRRSLEGKTNKFSKRQQSLSKLFSRPLHVSCAETYHSILHCSSPGITRSKSPCLVRSRLLQFVHARMIIVFRIPPSMH